MVDCGGLENRRTGNRSVGSNPTPIVCEHSAMVEHLSDTQKVIGSSPVVRTNM